MAIFRAALITTNFNHQNVNVWYFTAQTGAERDIAQSFEEAVGDAYRGAVSQNVGLTSVTVTDIITMAQSTEALSGVGARTGDMLPPQAAGVISWRTGLAGRKYRGRSYIPGIAEMDQAGGTLVAGAQANLDVLAGAVNNYWPAAFSGTHVIWHRDNTTPTPVSSWVIRPVVYTQRRRTLGVGT